MPEGDETKKPAEIKSQLFQNPWQTFSIEAFLFCLTLFLGIVTASRISEVLKFQKVIIPFSSQFSFWQFIFYFLLATLLIFLISYFPRFKKGKKMFFKIVFVLATFFGGTSFFSCWMSDPPALILMAGIVFWWLKQPTILNQDLCLILGMAGIGSILGLSLDPLMVALLLVFFSIYDFIAVYKTKHMIRMAKEMIESRAILALVIPPNISGFRESLEKIEPGGRFLILGGGDVVFPLLFAASLVYQGILSSLIVATFSLIGLSAGFYFFISQKVRQPIPALPPIALFSIIGFFITLII